MKRIFVLLLTFALVFCLAACDGSTDALLGEILDEALNALEETNTCNVEPAPGSDSPDEDSRSQNTTEDWNSDTTTGTTDGYYEESTDPETTAPWALDPEGWYYSAGDVSLYLYTYGELPENFITKSEAREYGWEGGSVEVYLPGYAIGGDTFGNREGLLPRAEGRVYYECDIDTNGANSRGAKRIVFSNDGLIYYTEDHYESFILLYGEE